MKNICLYFELHQPIKLRRYRFFDIGNDHYYYDDYANESNINKLAHISYLPANAILLDLMKRYKGRFNVAFSISSTMLAQLKTYAPEVIDSFREMAATGCVEFIAETAGSSMASTRDLAAFKRQVAEHVHDIEETFGQVPVSFRNTELIYSDEIGEAVAQMGFKVMLAEGAKQTLGWKSPNYMYCNAIDPRLKVLVRNYHMSDDIALRFSNQSWSEWPLTASKFKGWIDSLDQKEEILNLFMSYDAIGGAHSEASGIMEFLKAFPEAMLENAECQFITPSKAAATLQPVSAVVVPNATSWADEERDLTAWLGNEMQNEAVDKLYALAQRMTECTDQALISDWQYLQSAEHFYYMGTKFFANGARAAYQSPYATPYEAFINYMNVLTDFTQRLNAAVPESESQQVTELKAKVAKLESELSAKDRKAVKAAVSSETKTTAKKTTAKKSAADGEEKPKRRTTKKTEPKE